LTYLIYLRSFSEFNITQTIGTILLYTIIDLEALSKLLHNNYKEMSRWDIYEAEVESGNLSWGILHSEKFFRENCRQLEGSDGNFHLLKVLIALASSEDDEIASVACFDIGEFVRHYPNGRSIAKRLGAKEPIMGLIEHENPDLQRQALLCVSKMMVQNWSVSPMQCPKFIFHENKFYSTFYQSF
jgi:V-type H+-transporting ATPase subunit H